MRLFEIFERGKMISHRRESKERRKIVTDKSRIEVACCSGTLSELLEEYLADCALQREEISQKTSKKTVRWFPNIAGFCRYFHIGESEYNTLAKKYSDEFEYLSAVFEDEALNSDISPTVISAYLKKRLGYDRGSGTEIQDGQLRIVFEHDILEDGE